jgi:hypothetical protein
VGFWITSLLPTGPTGSTPGYVDNLPVAHIPTAMQVSNIQINEWRNSATFVFKTMAWRHDG